MKTDVRRKKDDIRWCNWATKYNVLIWAQKFTSSNSLIILKCFENQVNEIKAVAALTKPAITGSKSTMETPEQCVKSV